jgi:peptidyl-prolyl cis-trans isomerase SurA
MSPRVVAALVLAFSTAALLASLAPPSARAEVIEEIVAKVNDDIITMSELQREEQALVADLYRQYTGAELDRKVAEARATLLRSLIDRKLLIHRAERLYDLEKMEQVLLENFMAQQGIADLSELDRALAQEGLTLEELKRRLLEMAAPQEVIRFEVAGRLSVGDAELEVYYNANLNEFLIPAEVTLREIVLACPADQQADRMPEMEAIRDQLLAEGADFGQIAQQESEAGSAADGGLIGPFHKGDLVPALEDVAFTIPVGVISPIVATANGLHIIQVEERTDDKTLTLDEAREDLRAKLEDEKYSKALAEFLEKSRSEADIWVNPKYRAKYGIESSS